MKEMAPENIINLEGNTMMKYLQNLGRSLMLPVAVLPAAAILVGVSKYIEKIDGAAAGTVSTFLNSGGLAILDNLGVLFAVGVAIGMSREQDGAADRKSTRLNSSHVSISYAVF